MDFQEVLQALCKLTSTKVGVIAERLNYDRTIISKWKTGKRLPARQNHLMTIQVLGDLFAEELYKQDLTNEYSVLFNRKKVFQHPDPLAKDVKQLLRNGYRISELKREHGGKLLSNTSDFQDHTSDAILTDKNHLKILKNRISHLMLTTEEDFVIYSTFRLKYVVDLLMHLLKNPPEMNRKITFHIMMHTKDMEQLNTQEYLSVFKMLLTSSYYDIYLYQGCYKEHDEFFLIDQHLVGLMSFLRNEQEVLMISANEELFEQLRESNHFVGGSRLFNYNQAVDEHVNPLARQTDQAVKFLYSGFFSDFFFPPGFVQALQTNNMAKIEGLYDEWEELFFTSDIHLVMTKDALLNFIQTGRVQIQHNIVVVPMKYRIFMLKRAINIVGNSTRIHIYLVDKAAHSFLNDMNISLYVDDQQVNYVKNIELLSKADFEPMQKVVTDEQMVARLYHNIFELTKLFHDSKINLLDMNRILRIVNWLNQQTAKNMMQKIEKILFR